MKPHFKRLLTEYVSPYKKQLALAVGFMALVALSTAGLAFLMENVIDEIFGDKNQDALYYVAGAIFLTFAIKGISTYGQQVTMSYVGHNIIADFQRQMFNKLVHADMRFFHDTSTGSLISRFTNDVTLLRAAVSTVLTAAGRDLLSVIFLVAVMFHKDWFLASISFVAFPLAILPIARFGKRLRKASTGSQETVGTLASMLTQVFQGIRHVKAYGMEEHEKRQADKTINNLFKLNYKVVKSRAASHPLMEMLGGLAIVAVIIYGGAQVIEGTKTTGAFFAFITALLLAYEPMKKLANVNSDLQEGLSASTRVFALLDREPEMKERENPVQLNETEGSITFKNVHFSYTSEKEILKGVDLSFEQGKMVALVGPSGGGKSTILNLIPRFYDVKEGTVKLDGHDVRDLSYASLRKQIALVSQEVSLFDATIRDNIAYGRWTADDEEIIQAAIEADAHHFIEKLPDGYNTLIGEHGIKLSGGQRQRISIARAMLKNAPILLLDEATSALDTQAEKKVQAALGKLMQGRTTIVIAHRLSTIKDADHIYVIDQGQVVEQGTDQSLRAEKGLYAKLAIQMQIHEEAA